MPAINTNDLINAKLDADTIAGVATSTALTVTDRLGNIKNTLAGMSAAISASTAAIVASAAAVQGSLGYLPPVAYAAGISLTLAAQTVGYSGQTYAPIFSALPFTTSGTFETAKFRLIQGVSGADLAAPTGAMSVGTIQAGPGALATTVQAKLRETPSIADYTTATADDAERFQKLLNSNDHVVVVAGDWVINSMVTVPRSDMSIIVKGKLKIGVTRWMLFDGISNTRIKGYGGQIEFAAAVNNNNGAGIGAGIHFRNGSNGNSVSGLKVTTLNADRTLSAFVTGTASSCDNHVYNNELIDIGRPFIMGWTDDPGELDTNNIPTSNWNVSNNTMANCGRPAYANIIVRSLNNSFDRTDPYALTEHTIGNNTFRGMGGAGTTQIFIEYDSNGGLIVGNKLHGNTVDTYCHIAISVVKSCDTVIRDNRIQGLFNYQAIEMASCFGVKAVGNTVYGMTNASANCAAIGVSIGGTGPASEDCLIAGNHFFDCKVGVLTSGSSTAMPYSIRTKICSNSFVRSTLYGAYNFGKDTEVSGNTFTGEIPVSVFCGTVDILNNKMTTTASFCINTESGADVLNIKGNTFVGWGVAGQNAAIWLWSSKTCTISGNTFSSDGRLQAGWSWPMTAIVKISFGAALDVMHYIEGNNYGDVQVQLPNIRGSYSPVNTIPGRTYYSDSTIAGIANKVIVSDAAPTTGVWSAGDRSIAVTPIVGQSKGSRCTVSGTPGTWVSEGNL